MREDKKLALKFEGRTENARVRSGYSRVLRAGLRTKVDPRLPIQVKSLAPVAFRIWPCKKMFLSGSRTCCVITGASRGFGRSVAIALAREFSHAGIEGHFVLLARCEEGLQETRNKVIETYSCAQGKYSKKV